MMMIPRVFLWAAALLAAAPLLGHDFWIEPSTFRPAVGSTVTVSLLVGENLTGELVPVRPERIERFVALQGERETPINGEFTVSNGRLIQVIYRSRPNAITLEATKFESYLREEGLERIIDARAKRGEASKEGHEIYSRCAKSLLGSGTDRPSGLVLEIIAESERSFLVRYRNAPLKGALVTALNANERLAARTDSKGRVKFTITKPGFWLIKTVHMIEAPPDSGADWESLWASLTFEKH